MPRSTKAKVRIPASFRTTPAERNALKNAFNPQMVRVLRDNGVLNDITNVTHDPNPTVVEMVVVGKKPAKKRATKKKAAAKKK